ncbi:DUF2127 domain-containing protein (plasmid) [Bradyrhizobium guangxiense]|uniref:DUF2127 domain-containing protein n=1 Tax=Bradyrhizobium guangxiense TaxID=1325115 RepID=UPI003703E7ED
MSKWFQEQNLRLAFQISLIIKGVFALLEIFGGIAAYFVSQQFLLSLILAVTRQELTEDPGDVVVRYLLETAHNVSLSTQYFTSIYLLSHGVIKTVLIAGLLRKRLWYYPAAIVVFVTFIAYQLFRFNYTHSIWLLLITLLDMVVIWLTWHEYRYLQTYG